MKKIILGAILLFSMTLFGQTVYNGPNPLINNYNLGQNCGNGGNQTVSFNGILDLNYKILTLKNVKLEIIGSIINLGEIKDCNNGNGNGSSELFINGVFTPLPYNVTLSIPEFNFTKHYGYEFKVYDLSGRLKSVGVTNEYTFDNLPKNEVLILKVYGFKPITIVIQ